MLHRWYETTGDMAQGLKAAAILIAFAARYPLLDMRSQGSWPGLYGRYFFTEATSFRIAGVTTRKWIFFWGVYQSMVHFYFDGFLWKMRLPIYRKSI